MDVAVEDGILAADAPPGIVIAAADEDASAWNTRQVQGKSKSRALLVIEKSISIQKSNRSGAAGCLG